jgi:hypothetical protein
MATIPALVETVSAMLPVRFRALAPAIQAGIDAVTPAVETIGEMPMAMGAGARRTPVQAMVDAIAATIELVFAAVADAIEALFDAVAGIALEPGGHRGSSSQQQCDANQGDAGAGGQDPAGRDHARVAAHGQLLVTGHPA